MKMQKKANSKDDSKKGKKNISLRKIKIKVH